MICSVLGEGVAGQLEPESAPVGFQLCVSNPLQGRRREARRERGRGMQPLRVMTVESVSQSRSFPWRPLNVLEGHGPLNWVSKKCAQMVHTAGGIASSTELQNLV